MSDDEDNVIPVDFTAKPVGPVETEFVLHRKRRTSFLRVTMAGNVVSCGHQRIEIDEDTLDLECADCNERIDARLFVLEWAKRLRQLQWSREAVERLSRERDSLQREIRNLKAQKRRAER